MTRIAIIGAGLAGLHLASRLQDKADVTVFEKSRGVSGRLATRRIDDYEFDHGAQFFTARSDIFMRFLAPFISSGVVQPWEPRVLTLAQGEKPYRRDWFECHYVAVPAMTSLCKAMAAALDIRLHAHVTGISPCAGPPRNAWSLQSGGETLPELFDWVISTAPLPQTRQLFQGPNAEPDILSGDEQADVLPCYTLMLGFETLPSLPFEAARVKHASIDWIALNHSKPGRSALPAMVVQSTHAWARQHVDSAEGQVRDALLHDLANVLATPLPEPRVMALHRWRFAKAEPPLDTTYFLDADRQLAACGDGFTESRVEGAFLSANALADTLVQRL